MLLPIPERCEVAAGRKRPSHRAPAEVKKLLALAGEQQRARADIAALRRDQDAAARGNDALVGDVAALTARAEHAAREAIAERKRQSETDAWAEKRLQTLVVSASLISRNADR